jgi:Uma2 family endonuclease
MATIAFMAFVVGDRPVRPFTADQALQLLEVGVLPDRNSLELLHGVLTEKAVKGLEHEELKTRLIMWLAGARDSVLRVEGPIRVEDATSLPEPDLAAVEPGNYLVDAPHGAKLVIEVAKTSLKFDIEIKAPLFAATGIPDYWVVDVVARRVHVHRDPTSNGYATISTHGPCGPLAPLEVDVPPLDLAVLFDGLR